MKTNRVRSSSLLLLLLTACYPALSAAGALPRSSPEAQGVSSEAILAFVEAADQQIDTMNSFMFLRHGKVVAEGWWAPYDAQTPHLLFSLSKSFTSTAVGLAIEEGKLSLNDEALKFFPEDAPPDPSENLKAMRVRDLLRMSAGHQVEVAWTADQPWTKTFLAHPVPHKPGTHFMYNTPATYMLSAIVQKVTRMKVLDYLRPRLFEPLGIESPTWGESPQGVTLGGTGLSIRTEDIARFGQLYLQKGRWNGKQLIPAAWVEAATSLQTSNGSNPESDWDQGYGYQFWRCRHGVFRGDGAFGQYCIVMPDQDAVVVITSGVRSMQAVINLVWDKLLPAMKAQGLPPNRDAWERLEAKLRTLMVRPVSGDRQSPLAAAISGRTYTFGENPRKIESIRFQFTPAGAILLIKEGGVEHRIGCLTTGWAVGQRSAFTNGMPPRALRPGDRLAAGRGAWTAEDTYTAKVCLYETPFYITLNFKFAGDELKFDSEYNVAFGPTQLPQLIGHSRPSGQTESRSGTQEPKN